MKVIGVDFGSGNDKSVYVKSEIINGKIHVLETGNIEDLTPSDFIECKEIGENEDLHKLHNLKFD
ncbi:hypothetical protein ABNX05_11195 [Lysinibacillus sp. M3]|uniref:Uncharacterized protein n=1 Tax=Lysinibacillus zambalensis TaxID=3160866 RepID=A0ABV1MU99_9BACI